VAVEVNERVPAGELGLLEGEFDFVFVVVVEVVIVVFLMEFVRGDSVLTIDVVVLLENVEAGEGGVLGCCCV
jgi:hypothetical protein